MQILKDINLTIDDNKFVDCAVVANATCIVTEDKHFKELEFVDFPKVEVIGIDLFLNILKSNLYQHAEESPSSLLSEANEL